MAKLYYGGKGKDGKVLVYDKNGEYKTKWDQSKVIAEKLRPLTDIKPKAKVCNPGKKDSPREVRVGTHVLYGRHGMDTVAKVVVVEPKKIIVATYYKDGRPSKLYEFTNNDFALRCEPLDESDPRIPRDPKTPCDEYRVKLVDKPSVCEDGGVAFSAAIYHKKKKLGTVSCDYDAVSYRFDVPRQDMTAIRRAAKAWAAAVGAKPCKAVSAEEWWICYSIEQNNNLAITATEFFASESPK